MPCDTITTAGIELGANIDPSLLFKALEAMKLNPVQSAQRISFVGGWYDLQTKQATLRSSAMAGTTEARDKFMAEVKQAYGAELLKAQAKKYGWQLKETGSYKYQVIKNTY